MEASLAPLTQSSNEKCLRSSSLARFKTDLETKSRNELIELAIQLHQLLTQAFRNQNELSRWKNKCHYLEKQLLMLKVENTNKISNDSQLHIAGELVEQNYQLKSRMVYLEEKLFNLQNNYVSSYQRERTVHVHFKNNDKRLSLMSPVGNTNKEKYADKPPSCNTTLEGPSARKSSSCAPVTSITLSPPPVRSPTLAPKRCRPPTLKKAPPKLLLPKHNETSSGPHHRRLPFFWPPTPTKSPPRLTYRSTHQTLCKSDANQNDFLENESNSTSTLEFSTSANSIFDYELKPEDKQLLTELLADSKLEEWFVKKPHEFMQKQPTSLSTKVPVFSSKRPCVLSPVASQKYLITIRCLKKPYGQENGWACFKKAMYSCTLTRYQINLLLETIPDRETSIGSRKLHEWDDHVAKVQAVKKDHPDANLFEEEEFVYFISLFPDLHQRLQCMLIMESFSELLNTLSADIELLMDAIEVITRCEGLRLFFKCVLELGNYQNQGTSLGNRKWFRISALKRFINFRGVGPNGKSILTVVAPHLGPVIEQEDFLCIDKASQVSIAQVIEKAAHLNHVFRLLSDSTLIQEPQKVLPFSEHAEDQFAVLGRQFTEQHQAFFNELKQDIRRLLYDYRCCVTYLGDPEAFLPIDKRVEDERNPAQNRFIQDVFSFLVEILSAYRVALKPIKTCKAKKDIIMKSDSKTEPFVVDDASIKKRPLHSQSSFASTGFTTDHQSSYENTIAAPSASSSLIFSSSHADCSLSSIAHEQPNVTGSSPSTTSLNENTYLTRNLSTPIVTESIHHVITSSQPCEIAVPTPESFPLPCSNTLSHAICLGTEPRTSPLRTSLTKRRASLRPALFDASNNSISQDFIKEKDDDIGKHRDASNQETLEQPIKKDTFESHDLLSSPHSKSLFRETGSNGCFSTIKRRRESIRSVVNFLSSCGKISNTPQGHSRDSASDSFENGFEAPKNPLFSTESHDSANLTAPTFLSSQRSLLSSSSRSSQSSLSSRYQHYTSLLHSSAISNPSLILGQRLAARRLGHIKLEPVKEDAENT